MNPLQILLIFIFNSFLYICLMSALRKFFFAFILLCCTFKTKTFIYYDVSLGWLAVCSLSQRILKQEKKHIRKKRVYEGDYILLYIQKNIYLIFYPFLKLVTQSHFIYTSLIKKKIYMNFCISFLFLFLSELLCINF